MEFWVHEPPPPPFIAMSNGRPSGLGIACLVIGLVLVVGVILGRVPLATCPTCEGSGQRYATGSGEYVWLCESCNRGKLSLLKRWIDLRKAPIPAASLDWEGQSVSAIRAHGFYPLNEARVIAATGIRLGDGLTRKKVSAAIQSLQDTGKYAEVGIQVHGDPRSPGTVTVDLFVVER